MFDIFLTLNSGYRRRVLLVINQQFHAMLFGETVN